MLYLWKDPGKNIFEGASKVKVTFNNINKC
jgi:hypothetical protein